MSRHTGFASLPLHGGKAPARLFGRMVRLSREIVIYKDGTPFPVDRLTYDRTIEILNKAINRSAIDRSEKVKAFRRLANLEPPNENITNHKTHEGHEDP